MRRPSAVAFGVLLLGALACHDATAPRDATRRGIRARQQGLATGSFATFDAPGAVSTFGFGINSTGEITGPYIDAGNVNHGFVRARDGTITSFEAPGAGTGSREGTWAGGINDAGEVGGFYVRLADGDHRTHGYVRARDGTITPLFDTPGSVFFNQATAINASGVITGGYIGDTTFLLDGSRIAWFHGFVRFRDGGVTAFDVSPVGAFQTHPVSISSVGEIAGSYIGAARMNHGFVRAPDGTITTFDVPVAIHTFPSSINAQGVIAGHYTDAGFANHGFVRTRDGTITTFDVVDARNTVAQSINEAGDVAGSYIDGALVAHGFVRTADGTISTFDVPGASGTFAECINNSGAITGYYVANGVAHGFLFRPQG